jgi:hypothetical protein
VYQDYAAKTGVGVGCDKKAAQADALSNCAGCRHLKTRCAWDSDQNH